MLKVVNRELFDPDKNTQISIKEEVDLVETNIELATNNHSAYHALLTAFADTSENLENVDEDYSQAYFWTEEWQNAELEANEDISTGRVKRFHSVDGLINELQT
jgi:hypothetical protein